MSSRLFLCLALSSVVLGGCLAALVILLQSALGWSVSMPLTVILSVIAIIALEAILLLSKRPRR